MKLNIKATLKVDMDNLEKGVGKYVDRAVGKSLNVMERNIKYNTPVRHGYLRRSITNKKTGFGQGEVFTNPIGSIGSSVASKKGLPATKPVRYAVYVEYGTSRMAPRAMFRKGVQQSENAIRQIFKDEAKNHYNQAKGIDTTK